MTWLLSLLLQSSAPPVFVVMRFGERDEPSFVRTERARCSSFHVSLTYRTVPRNERRITDLKFNNRRLPAAQIDRVNEDEGVRRARTIYFRGCYARQDDSIEGIQLLAERSVPDPSDPNKSLVAISDFFVSEDGVSPGFPTERYRLRR